MHNYLDDLTEVAEILAEGKVILSPTDTIWGLGCNAFEEAAVEKIYSIKKRDRDKPLILLVSSIEQLKEYVKHVHPRIETLLHYHERPLTVIYDANEKLPTYLLGGDKTIAIRVTKDPMLIDLINLVNEPLVSTSANLQGEPSPINYNEISDTVVVQSDYVFNTGRNVKFNGAPSMLIRFDEEGELIFLRK